MATNAILERIYPFFIVDNLAESIDFYNQKLGFETDLLIPEEDPFFGIVSRDNVRILLKHITEFIHPVPNHTRQRMGKMGRLLFSLRILIHCLLRYQSRGLEFHEPLEDTDDGLRAFELKDHDGYVLCFGKPI